MVCYPYTINVVEENLFSVELQIPKCGTDFCDPAFLGDVMEGAVVIDNDAGALRELYQHRGIFLHLLLLP